MSADVFRPFRPWVWVAPLPVIAAASWLVARPPAGAPYDLWVRASASIHDSLAISGPLMFLWAAVLSAAATGRAWVFAAVPGPVRVRQHLRFVAVTTALALVAHLVGIAPRLVFAAQTATSDSVSIAAMVTAVAWVAIFCALGVVSGHVLSHTRWLLPLAPLIAIATFVPVVYDRAWAVLLPNKQWPVGAREHLSAGVTVIAVALAAAILMATALAVGNDRNPALRIGSRPFRRPGLGLVTGLLALVVVLGASFAVRPEVYVMGAPVEPVCRTIDSSTVCLHPAIVGSFPQVQELVGQLDRAGLAGYVPQMTDTNLDPRRESTPDDLMISVGPTRSPGDLTRNAVYALITNQCAQESGTFSPEDTRPTTIADGLAAAILARLGQSERQPFTVVDKRIDQLSPDQLAALLRDKQTQVQSCTLSAADIP